MFDSVLITGASKGIGAALSINYSTESKVLILIGRDKEGLEKVKEQCVNTNKNVEVVLGCFDISESNSFLQWLEEILLNYKISLVIANAGMLAKTGINAFSETFGTNVFGTFNTIFPVIEQMKKNKKGSVVIINSLSAFIPLPDLLNENCEGLSFSTYAASKRTILSWAILSKEYYSSFGIDIHLICPGYVKTNFLSYSNLSRELEKKIDSKGFLSVADVVKCVNESIKKRKSISFIPKRSRLMCLASFFLPLFLKQKAIEMSAKFNSSSIFQFSPNIKISNSTNICAFILSYGFGKRFIEEYMLYNASFTMCFLDENKEFENKILNLCSHQGVQVKSNFNANDFDTLISNINFDGDIDLLFFDFPVVLEDDRLDLNSAKQFFTESFGKLFKIIEKASEKNVVYNPVNIVISFPIIQSKNAVCNASIESAILYCESKREQLKKLGFSLSIVIPAAVSCTSYKFAFLENINQKNMSWIYSCAKSMKRSVAKGKFSCFYPHFLVVFLIFFKKISFLFPNKLFAVLNKKFFGESNE